MRCKDCDKREVKTFTFGNGYTIPLDWCTELNMNCLEAIYKCKALTNG